ncbi:MAG: MAPEG family protein [Caldimonas sp.]
MIGYVTSRGMLTDEGYKEAPNSPLPPWVYRANRAHVNAVENVAPLAAVVLIALIAGISTPLTVACAAVYFYARLRTRSSTSVAPGCSRRERSSSRSWIAFIIYALVVLARMM